MKGSLGLSYRENEYEFQSDNINTQGKSLNDQVLGLYPAGEANGYINSKEEYAELLVPILKDLPLIKGLDLSLGARHSDYNTTGGSYTYKAQFDYRTVDYLRFRGGYNRAERAPNIGELFLARTSSFGAMSNGDVCSMRNQTVRWTANSDYIVRRVNGVPEYAPNPNWMNILNMCATLNDRANPTGDANISIYGVTAAQIQAWTADHPNGLTTKTADMLTSATSGIVPTATYQNQSAGGFSWAWPLDSGNAALKPEVADTWTAGFVLDSFVDSIPALMDWRVSMDYYTIEVEDAIGLQTADVVLQQCFSPDFNPTFDPDSPYCAGVTRDARTGTLGVVERTYFNNGHIKTSGIDTQINWGMDLGAGHLAVNSNINYIISMKSSELPTNPMIEYRGTFGPTGNGLNGNTFKYKMFTNFNYSIADWNLSLRWSHYDKIKNRTGTASGLKAYDMFDLTGVYRMTDGFSINGGIENLFDTAPKRYNVNTVNVTNGMYGGSYSAQLQDSLGRRFYLGFKLYL
jgi:outer membrane receptor protein involved in Fe transport